MSQPAGTGFPASKSPRPTWWHIYEETRNGSAPRDVGFGTLFASQSVARREGKECPGWLPTLARGAHPSRAKRFAPSRQSILFLLACIRNPRCTKACRSPHPRPPSRPRGVSFIVSGFPACKSARPTWWHRLSSLCSMEPQMNAAERLATDEPDETHGSPWCFFVSLCGNWAAQTLGTLCRLL